MALDKLKNLFGGEEVTETPAEEEYYSTSRESYQDDNGAAGSKMILLEPRA